MFVDKNVLITIKGKLFIDKDALITIKRNFSIVRDALKGVKVSLSAEQGLFQRLEILRLLEGAQLEFESRRVVYLLRSIYLR